MPLHEQLVKEIKGIHQQLRDQGALPTPEQLQHHYATFKAHFGPDVLSRLDGEALLNTIHDHSNRDSLVYWLEFKNDEEFPAIFGSIAGGSALKFVIYRRRETGTWTSGSPQYQQELSLDEAIDYARKHRDQLIAGVRLLEKLPDHASATDYQALQAAMDDQAPDVSRLAWGHKYFSLLAPQKLDDYHNRNYQRFHLITLLQEPTEGDGRYIDGGQFVTVARELGLPMNHLTTVLNHRNGNPHRYWRIGTSLGDEAAGSRWPDLRDGNFVMIGWPDLGDLSEIGYHQASKDTLRALMTERYPTTPSTITQKTSEVFWFVALAGEGDLVVASAGKTVLGIGRIAGDYYYTPDSEYAHRRPVEWLHITPWEMPKPEQLRTTFREIKSPVNLIEVERHILGATPISSPTPVPVPRKVRLSGIPGHIQQVLERKKQVILYGPPGTGKTYWAEAAACDLAAYHAFGAAYSQLTQEQQDSLMHGTDTGRGLMRLCAFHPAYGYEDFFEGYRPEVHNDLMTFVLRDGIFKRLCRDAQQNPDLNFYLVIDEINRGDIPRIFGELITVLEADKRDKSIILPLSGESFTVPPNVYLIGTMNTADRSIALLDTALRRRFGFIELMPDSSVLGDAVVENIPLGPWLDALNERIVSHAGRDARNLQIGHAYLLANGRPVTDMRQFASIVWEDIVPLLEEYCYEDYIALERILEKSLVDAPRQRIRNILFEPGHEAELVQALLEPNPELATSLQAVRSEAETEHIDDEDLSDADDDTK